MRKLAIALIFAVLLGIVPAFASPVQDNSNAPAPMGRHHRRHHRRHHMRHHRRHHRRARTHGNTNS